MDGKRLAIKNLKLALTRLHVTDNIDVRIQQAELEFQLGREELNLLTCLEQSRALTVSLEEAGRHAAVDTATLHAALSAVATGQLVSLHACALRCAGSSLKFGAAPREGGAGLWIQWAAPGCGLDKGDRIVEVNGVCALQRSKEQLQRLLAAAEPALLVVMRLTADRAAATLASNVRLTHRISYLEDQVSQLLSSDRPTEPERLGSPLQTPASSASLQKAVFQKGRVTALVAEPEMHSTTLHVRAPPITVVAKPLPLPLPGNEQRPARDFHDRGGPIRTPHYSKEEGPTRSDDFKQQQPMKTHEFFDKGPMRTQEFFEKGPMRTQDFKQQGPMRTLEFHDKGPTRPPDFKERGPMRSQYSKEQGTITPEDFRERVPIRTQDFYEKRPMGAQDFREKGPMRAQDFQEKGPMRAQDFQEVGPMRAQDFQEKGSMRGEELLEKGPMRYESKTRLFATRADALSDNRLARGREGYVVGGAEWRQAEAEARLRDDLTRITARKTQLSAFLHDDRSRDDEPSGKCSPGAKSLDRGGRCPGDGWASDRYASDSGRPAPPRKPARLSLHKALSLSSVAALGTAPRKPAKRRHKQAAPAAPRQEKWC